MDAKGRSVSIVVYSIVLALAFAWVAGIFAVPVLQAHGSINPANLAVLVVNTYGRVCHEIPSRSFWIDGHPLAVCARCSGIYVGYLSLLLVYPLVRSVRKTETPARIWLLLGVLPVAVDFLLGITGIWQNTVWSRAVTGFIAGAVCVFYTLPGLVGLAETAFAAGKSRKLSVVEEK